MEMILIGRLFYFLLLQLVVYAAYSQHEVKGYVFDLETKEPLPGANIIVKGSLNGTIAKRDGSFIIDAPHNAELIFSFIGFTNEIVKIRTDSTFNIFMKGYESEFEVARFRTTAWDNPIRVTENEQGTISIYAEDTINFTETLKGKVVRWKIEGYQVIIPLDSLLSYLKQTKYREDDISYVLKYLQDNTGRDKIYLTGEVKKRLGPVPLNIIAIKLMRCQTIRLLDKKNKPVKFLIEQHLEWSGNSKLCWNCCWGGVLYFVPSKGKAKQLTLFRKTHFIC